MLKKKRLGWLKEGTLAPQLEQMMQIMVLLLLLYGKPLQPPPPAISFPSETHSSCVGALDSAGALAAALEEALEGDCTLGTWWQRLWNASTLGQGVPCLVTKEESCREPALPSTKSLR